MVTDLSLDFAIWRTVCRETDKPGQAKKCGLESVREVWITAMLLHEDLQVNHKRVKRIWWSEYRNHV